MSKYGTFKYSEQKYGTEAQDANLRWTFIVAWDGYWSHGNEAENMIDLTVERGRRAMLGLGGFEPFAPGRAVAIFDNSDGRYDPWNTSSPLYPHISPGKFVRIAVYDHSLTTNYGIMRGVIEDIISLKRGGKDCTLIRIVDGLSWLQAQTIHVGLQQSIDKDAVLSQILDHADWPDEWPTALTTDTDELTYWWAWAQNAYKALVEFNRAECAVAFHDRDGYFTWRPRDYAHERTTSIDQSEILADIGRSQPWEHIRNAIRVTSSPKALNACNEILWQLRGTPAILHGETFYIEPIFKYQEWQPCGAAIAFNFTVNAEAGGGGADLSANCTLEYDTDIGEGARLWLTNHSGTDGYITLFKATGDAIYAPSVDIREASDATSQADNGARVLEITSRWVEETAQAKALADWLLLEFKDPRDAPIIQMENRTALQYNPDLYDQIILTAAHLGIRDAYRIGTIEHQWLSENGQSVRTTMRLEPYTQYPGGQFMAFKGALVCRITTAQEIPNADATEVEFNAENHDITGWHSITSNTGRLTVPTGFDGYYRIFAQIKWEIDAGATGLRILYIKKNGGATALAETVVDATNTNMVQFTAASDLLAAGDYLTVEAYQSSGGALDVEHGIPNTLFGVDYLGS